MTRLSLLLLLASLGCVHVQPVGPLAGTFGSPANPGPMSKKGAAPEAPEPIVRQAPRPTVPAVYVTPGEVTAINAEEAAKRLQQELETDRRAMDAMGR